MRDLVEHSSTFFQTGLVHASDQVVPSRSHSQLVQGGRLTDFLVSAVSSHFSREQFFTKATMGRSFFLAQTGKMGQRKNEGKLRIFIFPQFPHHYYL